MQAEPGRYNLVIMPGTGMMLSAGGDCGRFVSTST
jgi:hypothetical protein